MFYFIHRFSLVYRYLLPPIAIVVEEEEVNVQAFFMRCFHYTNGISSSSVGSIVLTFHPETILENSIPILQEKLYSVWHMLSVSFYNTLQIISQFHTNEAVNRFSYFYIWKLTAIFVFFWQMDEGIGHINQLSANKWSREFRFNTYYQKLSNWHPQRLNLQGTKTTGSL